MKRTAGSEGAINLADKLARVSEHWSPRVVAELNDYQFKVVKLLGEFVWHSHADTDEAFIVLKGSMEVGLPDRVIVLGEGEMYVVPRGVRHVTRAESECHALIVEPKGVVNTGEGRGPLTAPNGVWV
jgi:mannose-6-phosphate isomerase-like protein (cupin superfamily)